MVSTASPVMTSMNYDMNVMNGTMNGTEVSDMNSTMSSMVMMKKSRVEIFQENAYEVGKTVS